MNKVIVDKARLLRRAIVISWATLALCFIVKIFGGNFFEIMCENPNYKALCEYADTHLWLKFIIGFLSSMLCEVLYLLAIIQKYKMSKRQFILTSICVAISCFIKLYSSKFGILGDVLITLLLPMFFVGKNFKKYIDIFVAIVLSFSFQLLSLLVRNLGIVNVGETYFVGLIFMIDVYLMFFLYYLYRNYNKKEMK